MSNQEIEKAKFELSRKKEIYSQELNFHLKKILQLTNVNQKMKVEQTPGIISDIPIKDIVSSLGKNMAKLGKYLNGIGEEVEEVCQPLRQLQIKKVNLENTHAKAEKMLNLKDYQLNLDNYIENLQFEEACELCVKAGSIEDVANLENTEFNQFLIKQEKLKQIISEKFTAGIQTKNKKIIEKFTPLMNCLHLQEKAIKEYIIVLVEEIQIKCENEIKLMKKTRKKTPTSSCLENILHHIANFLSDNEDKMERLFGISGKFNLLQVVEHLGSKYTHSLTSAFEKEHNTGSMLTMISEDSLLLEGQRNATFNTKYFDQIDFVCEEISSISNTFQEFITFLHDSTYKAIIDYYDSKQEIIPDNIKELKEKIGAIPKPKIYDLLAVYVTFERHFMFERIKGRMKGEIERMKELIKGKVTSTTELNGGEITQTVDDIFFILDKCIKRGLSSMNISTACAMINHAGMILSEEFAQSMEGNISYYLNISAKSFLQNLTSSSLPALKFTANNNLTNAMLIATLNSLQLSCSNIHQLRIMIIEEYNHIYMQNSKDNSKEMLISSLQSLDETTIILNSLRENKIEILIQTLENDYLTLFTELSTMDLSFPQDKLEEMENNDPFWRKLKSRMKNSMKQWKEQLCNSNLQLFIKCLSESCSMQIETVLLKCKISYGGGLLINRDVLKLADLIQNVSSIPTRKYFFKLLHIASILTLETLEDLFDYMASNPNDDVLPHINIKRILKIRTDFEDSAIQALNL